jgi:hypothetical protein
MAAMVLARSKCRLSTKIQKPGVMSGSGLVGGCSNMSTPRTASSKHSLVVALHVRFRVRMLVDKWHSLAHPT